MRIVKEFLDFVEPPNVSQEEQLETRILQELQMFGYYPMDKADLEIIKRFSTQLIQRLKDKKR
jgi:hypothetical protein